MCYQMLDADKYLCPHDHDSHNGGIVNHHALSLVLCIFYIVSCVKLYEMEYSKQILDALPQLGVDSFSWRLGYM